MYKVLEVSDKPRSIRYGEMAVNGFADLVHCMFIYTSSADN